VNCDPNFLSQVSSSLRALTDAQLMLAKTSLLCTLGGGSGTGGGSTPPILGNDPVVQQYINDLATLRAGAVPNMPVLDKNAISCLNAFVRGCRTDGTWSSMIEVNCIVFINGGVDNLSLAMTPLILGPAGAPINGNRMWQGLGFTQADATINGTIGNVGGQYRAFTSMIPANILNDTSAGITIYSSNMTNTAAIDVGTFGTVGSACFQFSLDFNDNKTRYDCWENADLNGETQAPAPGVGGFYSASRIAASDTRIYFGNSTNAFAQIGATNVNPLGGNAASCNQAMLAWCTKSNAGTPFDFTDRRLSFIAVHKGLTAGQTQSFFNRVQTLRTCLGGGFV
jgi:hypothetical protein